MKNEKHRQLSLRRSHDDDIVSDARLRASGFIAAFLVGIMVGAFTMSLYLNERGRSEAATGSSSANRFMLRPRPSLSTTNR